MTSASCWLLVAVVACGPPVQSPQPPAERFAIAWFVSQGLWGTESLTIDPSGLASYRFESARGKPNQSGTRRLSSAELRSVREAVRDPGFCELRSARHGIPDEGKPTLKRSVGERTCAVTLWDGEWEQLANARPALEAIKAVIAKMRP